VPLVTILVVLAFDVRGLSASTLMLMAVCPGMPLLLDTTRSVAGAAGTAFGALLLTATIEPLLIPFWTRLLSAVHPTSRSSPIKSSKFSFRRCSCRSRSVSPSADWPGASHRRWPA
jgi:hypothetical protein